MGGTKEVTCWYGEASEDEILLHSFGYNNYGQLGVGDAIDITAPKLAKPMQNYLEDEETKPGRNKRGHDESQPDVDEYQAIAQIDAGTFHSLLLTDQGRVYSFGDGQYGQLGIRNCTKTYVPTLISEMKEVVVQVGAGAYHSIILTESGNVYTFGSGQHGRLGHGNESAAFEPKLVRGLKEETVTQVAGGGQHCAVLTDEGHIYTFGYGEYGQLGHGDEQNLLSPKKLAWDGPLVTQIAAGATYTVLLTEKGEMYNFGCSKDGKLGHNHENRELRPRRVESLSHEWIVQVGAGGCHIIVLTDEGTAYTAGHGGYGQLGHGASKSQVNSLIFRKVEGFDNITQVDAGDWHSVIVTKQGQLYTFGNSGFGQLGHGVKIDENRPRKLQTLEKEFVSKVAAGYGHTLVLTGNPDESTLCQDYFNLLNMPRYQSFCI